MRGSRKPAHVGANFRDDDLGTQLADPRDRTQLFDRGAKAGKPSVGLPIDLRDGNLERVDLLKM